MIRTIKGKVTHHQKDGVVIETGGIGYLVSVPSRTWPSIGSEVFYYTFHLIREGEQALYGFGSQEELNIFNVLLGVNSIGPKLAMGIISNASPTELHSAIQSENITFFASLPGIGKKSATKIIIELKDKITSTPLSGIPNQSTELYDTLTTLGFSREEISTTIKGIPENLETLNDKIKWSLSILGK